MLLSLYATSLWSLLHMLRYYYNAMQTMFCAHINSCFEMLWVFYTSLLLSIALLHFKKDDKHGLLNSLGLKFVPFCCQKERNEIHPCRMPSTSWILGNKEPFVGLQNLWDNDFYVWWRFFKQFITISRKKFMANTLDKSELQNLTLEGV
jgi:hypothetical protein